MKIIILSLFIVGLRVVLAKMLRNFRFSRNLVAVSESRDPIFNLSLDNFIMNKFKGVGANIKILLLSSSNDHVSIGKTQNCYRECRMDRVREDGVKLVRRDSGGGACYVDGGNLLFSFVDRMSLVRKGDNYDILIRTLRDLGFGATFSGKNDVLIHGKKVSGSAFTYLLNENVKKHHGTILFNVDKERLSRYLSSHNLKLESKGIRRVVNLRELDDALRWEDLMGTLISNFDRFHYMESEKIYVGEEEMMKDEEFRRVYDGYCRSEWIYGENPDVNVISCSFVHKFSFGMLELMFKCEEGVIEECYINSDSIDVDLMCRLPKYFVGLRMDAEMPSAFLKRIVVSGEEKEVNSDELIVLMEIHGYVVGKYGCL